MKIRNKRLAKLGTQTSSTPSPSSESPASSTSPSTQPPRDSNVSANATAQQATSQGVSTQGKRIRITPAASSDTTASSTPTPSKRPTPRSEETLEPFEDRTLRALFCITLDENQQKDIHGQKLTFLSELKSELEEEGSAVRVSVGVLDQAILEAASNTGRNPPLHYLLPCWKRVRRLLKGFRKTSDDDPKFAVISEAKRLCLSYCIFAITMPDMFKSVIFGIHGCFLSDQ